MLKKFFYELPTILIVKINYCKSRLENHVKPGLTITKA